MKQIVSKKKGIAFLFLFLLSFFSLNLVGAQPPAQVNVNTDTGMDVEFTKIATFQNSQDHFFNVHVFNRSTGLRVTNDTTDCNFHLFDNKGFHLINQFEMEYDTSGLDWDLNVTANNFTRNGEYATLVACNASDIGGFASFGFEVTPTGVGDTFNFYIIILLISAVIIIFGFWIRDGWVVILGTFGLYFVGLYILLNGIVGIRDMVTTWAIALVILAVAAYLSVKSGVEMIDG